MPVARKDVLRATGIDVGTLGWITSLLRYFYDELSRRLNPRHKFVDLLLADLVLLERRDQMSDQDVELRVGNHHALVDLRQIAAGVFERPAARRRDELDEQLFHAVNALL